MIIEKLKTITPWPKHEFHEYDGYRILEAIDKMPNCPVCAKDELTFIQPKTIMCMACHKWFINKD